jgi:hypothetical protein
MSKYLALILGLCGLTTPSVKAVVSTPLSGFSPKTQLPCARFDFRQNSASPSPSVESAQTDAEPQSGPSARPQTAPPARAASEPDQAQPDASATPTKAPGKKRRRKTAARASTATPEKKVVRNGGTTDPEAQLAPGMSAEQASSQRQRTSQLLAATDANLKQISAHPATSNQQDSISQIRKYMEQAKTAEQAGDEQRAYNLASKARLLSDDLVKH